MDGDWGIVRTNPDICESTYFLHESSFHPHETSESALQSGFLSLVYTDPDFKMCGFKNDFKINRRSMYEKMHSLKKTDDFSVKQIIFTEY